MELETKRRLFVDMDGVLADFDASHEKAFGFRPTYDDEASDIKWERVHGVPLFFRNLTPMADAFELWEGLAKYAPTILTGVPRLLPYVAQQKREWLDQHLGQHVQMTHCYSRDKYLHGRPGDILIDDREKCGGPWVKMGGVWIVHVTAVRSLEQVKEILG